MATPTPKQLFDAGDLRGAIEAQTQLVKAAPNDANRRSFLFELLCFAGDLDRAQKQLDVIGHQNAQTEWAASVYGNLLECERIRRRCYAEGKAPEFFADPPEHVRLHVDAMAQLAWHRPGEAKALVDRAADLRPVVTASVNGQPAGEFRDCDDLLAGVLELMVIRDYIWLPWEEVQTLQISPPERPRDLIWIPAKLTLRDGTARNGYLPTLYCGTHTSGDDQLRLGRVTDWRSESEGPVLGVGQHQFLSGEADLGLLQIRSYEAAGA